MKAPITEIFSSIQGEGLLIGRRQIFIRFAGCNIDCVYCDTPKNKNISNTSLKSIDELNNITQSLITPDFHSLSFTGGEPLLYSEFIKSFLKKNPTDALLETNGTLPDNLNNIVKLIKHASVDLKLPEHFIDNNNDNILKQEIKSINILMSNNVNIYCKVVILPSTKLETIKNMSEIIKKNISDYHKIPIVLQPVSPIENWFKHTSKIFKISETFGEQFNVLTIPQIHKFLKIR